MKFSYGRVAFFEDFGRCLDKALFWSRFGRVLGRVLGGFWASKTEKQAFKRGPKTKPKNKTKRDDKKREILPKGRRPAAELWVPGREDLGPKT